MSKSDKLLSSESWQASVRVIEDFIKSEEKLDSLLRRHGAGLDGGVLRRVQYLSYGVIRDLGRLQFVMQNLVRKLPKKRLQAMLMLGIFEYLEAREEDRPRVVHYVVEQVKRKLSKAEGRFVNAVMRKLPESNAVEDENSVPKEKLSVSYSHPDWMIARWLSAWGEEETRRFLEWNQALSKIYVWSPVSRSAIPNDWFETPWEEFYEIRKADWSRVERMLASGEAYIQDPSTRIGPSLVEGQSVRSVLDLCAAPGGKSIQLQRYISEEEGLLVSLDVSGPRFDRLRENLGRYERSGIRQVQVAADLLTLEAAVLPQSRFELVYLDVPCSNTGVLQRRPDVKWRQTENGLQELIALQKRLLCKASEFVQSGGALIYSTCSVESAENEGVVDAALEEIGSEFSIERSVISLPWISGHDGAGACLLRRSK